MRLSEAIRMNGMMKPQGFGAYSFYSVDQPCALGGALQSIGEKQDYGLLRVWAVTTFITPCPACSNPEGRTLVREELRRISPSSVLDIVWHLNDGHRYTRSQIADWVATVEPSEPDQEPISEKARAELAKVSAS